MSFKKKKKISVSQEINSRNSKGSAGVSASFRSTRLAFQKITEWESAPA